MSTVKEIFGQIEADMKAKPDETKAIDGVFKFVVTGDQASTWIVDARELAVSEGEGDGDVTITVGDADFVAMDDGSLDAMQAFMMGKIQVEGDMGLAMKLQSILGD